MDVMEEEAVVLVEGEGEEEEVLEAPDEVATKVVPENNVWTRCSAFIAKVFVFPDCRASFICGIDSPVKVASLTTADPRTNTQSTGTMLLAWF